MAITAGANLNLTPLPQKYADSSNYIDFTASGTNWTQQYLPELMEKEAEVFGKRTISGFLAQIGAEEAMTADQVVWSEQGRLHLAYNGQTDSTAETITISSDIDGRGGGAHGIRVSDTILISSAVKTVNAIVEAVSGSDITVGLYDNGDLTTVIGGSTTVTVLVYGTEYGKGQSYKSDASTGADTRKALEPQFQTHTNKPMILKDYYEINGSDVSQIGWVEVTTEEGQGGYLWYLKAASETKMRFTDYLEMAMLESVKGTNLGSGNTEDMINGAGEAFGTQGLFDAIAKRGNTTSGVNGLLPGTDLEEFDQILAEFDKQGAIEENMMFLDRNTSLNIDDMLAGMNSYGSGGTSYGVFNNQEDMALNLGFSGFRRGSYDFYKSDFRYLNDKGTRGGLLDTVTNIRGVIIPAGTSTVYDGTLGKNLTRPFLHVRYRASQTDDRRLKSWVTGSVGAATSALDAMQVHYLSERCLVTQGANNFMLMK